MSELTLNQQIAALLNTRPADPASATDDLISQLETLLDGDMYQECWTQYITDGDYFPAGGLWFSYWEWLEGYDLEATPDNVAYMLDNDGDLPPTE